MVRAAVLVSEASGARIYPFMAASGLGPARGASGRPVPGRRSREAICSRSAGAFGTMPPMACPAALGHRPDRAAQLPSTMSPGTSVAGRFDSVARLTAAPPPLPPASNSSSPEALRHADLTCDKGRAEPPRCGRGFSAGA